MLLVLTKWFLKNNFGFKKMQKDDGRSEKSHFLMLSHHKGSVNAKYWFI